MPGDPAPGNQRETDRWGNPAGGTPVPGIEGGVVIRTPDGLNQLWIKGEYQMSYPSDGFMSQPTPGNPSKANPGPGDGMDLA